MKNIKFFYITASNKKEAERIAKKLLNKRLIACANVISNVNSYFVWKNKIQNSKEIIICGKTTSKNQKKIIKVIHPEVRIKMNKFLIKNRNKKIVVLDIPLLLENKINKKNDVLIFVGAEKSQIYKRLKRRQNFNLKLFKKLKKIQLPVEYKKKKSQFILKNNFTNKFLKKGVKRILKEIL